MKTINKLIILLSCAGWMACSDGLSDQDSQKPEEKGEPVNILFDFYSLDVTKAGGTKSVMETGKRFSIYAFNQTRTDLTTSVGSGIYTMQADGTATGNMSLYSGEYDFYLVSLNAFDVPTLLGSGGFSIDNGVDFMYNTLKGVSIKPENPGQSTMVVTLPTPFTRLGAQVVLSVKANPNSPVPVTNMKVESITVKNLSAPLTYQLGAVDWETWTGGDQYGVANSQEVTGFTSVANAEAKTFQQKAEPVVLLPVDGSAELLFDLVLWVTYGASGSPQKFTYSAAIEKKSLQKGMKYAFDFKLTFFGELQPGDITVTWLGFEDQTIGTDPIGK